jgi:hypothetical protein
LIVRDLLEHRDRDVFLQADDTVLVGERRDPAPGDDGDKPDGKKAEPADAKKKKVSVLLVSPDNFFLAKAVSALPGVDAKLIGTDDGYPLDPEPRYDVIIYDRVAPPKYPERGNFICIGVVPPRGLRLREVPAPASDKLPDGRQRPVRVQEVAVDRWERNHPILRGLDLGELFVESAGRIAPAEGSEVLVEGKGDPAVPLVVLHREEGRTFLVLPFSVLDSNWPIKVSFPVFLKQAVDYLAGQGRNE